VPFSTPFAGNLPRSDEDPTQAGTETGDAPVRRGIHTHTADDHGAVVGHNTGTLHVQPVLKARRP
jgi:hypothetical protein